MHELVLDAVLTGGWVVGSVQGDDVSLRLRLERRLCRDKVALASVDVG